MEKNVEYGLLLDYYGDFLTERQRLFMDMHFNRTSPWARSPNRRESAARACGTRFCADRRFLAIWSINWACTGGPNWPGTAWGRLRAALKDALLQPEDRWALTQCIDELERALQA